MKSMRPPLAAIFFMTYLSRAGGGHGPLAPPGSATDIVTGRKFPMADMYLRVINIIVMFCQKSRMSVLLDSITGRKLRLIYNSP